MISAAHAQIFLAGRSRSPGQAWAQTDGRGQRDDLTDYTEYLLFTGSSGDMPS